MDGLVSILVNNEFHLFIDLSTAAVNNEYCTS